MNQLHIIGRFTADPDIREFQNADGVHTCANFTLAVPGRKKGDPADFFRCTAWGAAAELLSKYCHKGDKLAVTGPISFYSYTNKDGVIVYTHVVTVEHFDFMSKREEAENTTRKPASGRKPASRRSDALPF